MSQQPTTPTEFPNAVVLSKTVKWGKIVGLVMILIGVTALVSPTVTALAVDIWIGILLLIAGASCVFQAIQTRNDQSFFYDLFLGLLYLTAGMTLVAYPKDGTVTIAFILGLAFIVAGISRFVFAARLEQNRSRRLWIVDGAMGVILGAVILANWPGDSGWIIGVLVGLRFLMAGIATIAFSRMIQLRY